MVGDLKSTKPRSAAKREAIAEAAMRHFAEHGYQGARVEDLARELGIAQGSIFQHLGTKAGLFLATHERAVSSLPAWLDAPSDVVEAGFWSVLEYWLGRTEQLIHRDWGPHRGSLSGNYGRDLTVKRGINRFLPSEGPYGTLDFVEFGIRRNEVRADVDAEMIASMLDWLAERFQHALVTEELDPGLFHRRSDDPQRRRELRIHQFTELLPSAIGPREGGSGTP